MKKRFVSVWIIGIIVLALLLVGRVGYTVYISNSSDKASEKIGIDYKFDDSLSSVEYARLGNKTWSYFECAVLAGFLEKEDVSNSLFKAGYESGLTYIEASQKGLITDEDISKKVPVGLSWEISGPNSDFILGKVFNVAKDNVLEDVFQGGGEWNSRELQISTAETKYNRSNCELF